MVQAPQSDPNGPRSRAGAAEEPPAQTADTNPPEWLSDDAHAAWVAAVALLTSVRIVAKSDLTALARYCQLLTEWIGLTEAITRDGHVTPDRFGQDKLNPSVTARDSIERAIRGLEKALGLDPQSYMDLTRDLSKALTGKHKVGGRSPGGFLKTGKK